MPTLVGDALDAVLLPGDELLDHGHLFKALFPRAGNGGRQARRALHLGDAAAAGAVGRFDDERIAQPLQRIQPVTRPYQDRTGGRVPRRSKRLAHLVLVGGFFAAAHAVAGQAHLFGHIVDGHSRQVAGDGADAVDADLAADAQDLLFFHDADGVETVGHPLPHVAGRPGKDVRLAAQVFGFLDQRRLQIGRPDDRQLFHSRPPAFLCRIFLYYSTVACK